jgi:hypothetical protein
MSPMLILAAVLGGLSVLFGLVIFVKLCVYDRRAARREDGLREEMKARLVKNGLVPPEPQ